MRRLWGWLFGPRRERIDRRLLGAAPCPFCGSGKPLDFKSVNDRGVLSRHVRCSRCGAYGPAGETRPAAFEEWSKRAR